MPVNSEANCFIDSFGSDSLSNSGRTVTSPMCKKLPAVNGNIQLVRDSEN